MRYCTLVIILLAAFAVSLSTPSLAAEDGIAAIKIEGIERVDEATVRSYIAVRKGDAFDPGLLDTSLKSLFRTGLFADVQLVREGQVLLVKIKENPVINKVSFEGNSALSTETLEKEVQLRSRTVYTRTKVQNDVQRLLDLYRRSGRFAASVDPKIVTLEQNRVDLVFEINEGKRTEVRRITFVGNKAFTDSTLRTVVATKESAWWRLLSSDDSYDPDRLSFDEELLRRHYLENGYADFRVVSNAAELSQDKTSFFITVTVAEGEKYQVSKVNFSSSLKNIDAESFRVLSLLNEGDDFNNRKVEKTVAKITEALGNLGYAFVEITPQFQKDETANTIAITYEIQEGPKVYVDRINIAGNVRTLDSVVRREFQLAEGDPFNTDKIKETERRLKNLGYFSKVDIKNAQGTAPDRTDIQVNIEEQSTGEISVGAGFSSTESLLGDIRLRERNFLGRGQDVTISTTISARRQEYDLSFTEPYLFGRDMSGGIDLFRTTSELQQESSYDEQRTGGGLRVGYELAEDLRHTLRYVLRDVRISNVDSGASAFIKQQEGKALTSAVGHDLVYDKRDNRQEPSQGYYVRGGNEIAGLGGDVKYVRSTLGSGFFFPLGEEEWVFGFENEAGFIGGYGDEKVRINDRFFVGGNNLRGFEQAGIGPRDKLTRDALGGKLYATGTAEMRFPLGLPEDLGISGRSFVDAGTLADPDQSSTGIFDNGSIRAAAGFGLTWRSPFGPVRVDLAQAIAKEEYDRTEFFRFNFGTRF
ncbi:MAG: outer membrane protein assembly factor BamA [Alphaproteobacteria bacterium]|jgi:outer membrane protein insertion porin family|nr:outer membrane protein assembly factor BamA [Alphaproteobacteria bacterium]